MLKLESIFLPNGILISSYFKNKSWHILVALDSHAQHGMDGDGFRFGNLIQRLVSTIWYHAHAYMSTK